ncbi:MAG: CHAT domain-containing protein [Flavobacteriales bacterium]|nr:CHAT domain-containing protein [Flavobacteriales bacterium]
MKTQKQNFTNLKNSKVVSRIFKNALGIMILTSLATYSKNNHRGLSELNYTLQEAKSIENTRDGEFLLNSNASKKAFETLAKNYSIIHLSTHATSGDYYTPPAIEFHDETLYLPEIYGYNLQADLLVLSACETGIGTLRKGEGSMSLARGFSYAGVKNLLVSLWKVNDKSTEEIMAGFYKNHEQSVNKSEALHTSKLAYINNETISASKNHRIIGRVLCILEK